MEPWVIIPVAAALIAGLAIGMLLERRSWTCRAMPPGQTAHHCDGKWYYVIEEGHFNREYQLRNPFPMSKAIPPQGGSGTAPPQNKETKA